MRDLFSQCRYVRMYVSVTLQESQVGLVRAFVRIHSTHTRTVLLPLTDVPCEA